METDKTADELALTVKQCGPKSEPTISHTSFITADSPPYLATAYGGGAISEYEYCSGLHKKVVPVCRISVRDSVFITFCLRTHKMST